MNTGSLARRQVRRDQRRDIGHNGDDQNVLPGKDALKAFDGYVGNGLVREGNSQRYADDPSTRCVHVMRDTGHMVYRAMQEARQGSNYCSDSRINKTVYQLIKLAVIAVMLGRPELVKASIRALMLMTDCVPVGVGSFDPVTWTVLAG